MPPFELRLLMSSNLTAAARLHPGWPSPKSCRRSAGTSKLDRSSAHSETRAFHSSRLNYKPQLVLGIESSADDSCAAIVSSDKRILSNIVIKQEALLQQYGGIHPLHAQESHQRNVPVAIRRALDEAKLTLSDLDAIAFTRGPGMYGCLSTCAGSAKTLAAATSLPLLGVHHMQAHALTPFLTESEPPVFPFLTLLLSGGHSLLLLARSVSGFQILATTRDESIGTSLDKGSRDLGIPIELGNGSAGAALEAFAFGASGATPDVSRQDIELFPIPFRKELAFSFSGSRSALTRAIAREPVAQMDLERKRKLASAFMMATFKQVEEKVALGIELFDREERRRGGNAQLGGLVVSGGVASNMYLRQALRNKLNQLGYQSMRLIFPPPHLCTDNAAMIAHVGVSRLSRQRIDPLSVDIKSKWSIEECELDFDAE